MSSIPLQWEMALLLITMPIYVLSMAVAIVQHIPHSFRGLNMNSSEGNPSTDKKSNTIHLAQGILLAGLLLHTTVLIIHYFRTGHVPLTNFYESLLFFSWSVILVTLCIGVARRISLISIGTIPLALLLMGIALFNITDTEPLTPILQTYWLVIHAGFSFLSYTAYAIAFIAGVLYLFQEREIKLKKFGVMTRFLPPLESLDHLNYTSIFLGFILLTIGILTGALWSKQTHSVYWQGTPKEFLAVFTWILYAILLQIRLTSRWRGRKVAYLSILCFGFVILTWTFIFQQVSIRP